MLSRYYYVRLTRHLLLKARKDVYQKSGAAFSFASNASICKPHLAAFNDFSINLRSFTSSPLPEITQAYNNITNYEELHRFSLEKPDLFWGTLGKSKLSWRKEFSIITEHDLDKKIFRWFPDGVLNVSENCLDRHVAVNPDKVALIWEKDEPGTEEYVTYRELLDLVCRIGNVLRDAGVKKRDRVALYLPVSPLAVASMLACARIGAIHSVVFAGFSAESLASRIMDANAETVITMDQSFRGGKLINLKKTVDDAVAKCPSVKRVFVSSKGNHVAPGRKDIDFDEVIKTASSDCTPSEQSSEDLLFLLYTSGSTGTPKGVAHSSAGYLLYAALTHKLVFDYQEGDVFGCVADIGWITGHTYVVYGPLANGATTVLFESTPTYPDPGRYWETVSRLKLTHFYCAPTALRLLLRYGDSWVQKYDTSSLRVLGSVGEPINHEAWHWLHDVVGRAKCTLVDTWWQTETGGILISPRPSSPNAPIIPGMPMRPMFGINPVLFDPSGKEAEGLDVGGALCIDSIWPGIARTIYGDHQRYIDTYFKPFPGHFFSGDGAHRNNDGYYQITGRMDDVINVTGHRIGTAEIEDAMDEHPMVAETAVVGFPHDIKGEGIYAFVVLKENVTENLAEIRKDLKKTVKTKIAGHAIPEHIMMVPGLPKTRSGKILRRLLRKIASNQVEDLGDITTLANPQIVQEILKSYKQMLSS